MTSPSAHEPRTYSPGDFIDDSLPAMVLDLPSLEDKLAAEYALDHKRHIGEIDS
jgi:hypothetical protein